MEAAAAYQPDRSLKGKARRRLVRLVHRRPLAARLRRSMVSFTFDDAPASAAGAGAAILEAAGARATFYIAAGLLGRDGPMGRFADGPDIVRLAAAGHEIACHTFSHRDCGQASGADCTAETQANAAALEALGVAAPVNFAYPYGDVSAPAKAALAGRFATLRALHHGLVTSGCDLNQAPGVGVEGPGGEAVAMRWLRAAAARRGWLILYAHDVADPPSAWGCTPATLTRLIAAARARDIDIVTVAEGAARAGV